MPLNNGDRKSNVDKAGKVQKPKYADKKIVKAVDPKKK